jgi:hypothetical protein
MGFFDIDPNVSGKAFLALFAPELIPPALN